MLETLTLHRPGSLTKELAVGSSAAGRRVVISSNFLDLYGFSTSSRYERMLIGGGGAGFSLKLNTGGVQQVYRRTYTRRRANPFETQIDIHAQSFLDQALPTWAERVHVTMRPGELAVRPVPNQAFHIRKKFRENSSLAAFMALSSGVDAHCLQSLGFQIAGLVEWRPPEKRDGEQDLSESGMLTALANVHPANVFNEDITRIDIATIRAAIGAQLVSVLHLCIGCDDYSTLKGTAARQQSLENGTSTRDMIYDALRLTDGLRPACLVIECVAPFASSAECDMARMRLKRWGYEAQLAVLDARDFMGTSARRRAYLVASLFPGFEFPRPTPRRTAPLWNEFADEIGRCRDVSSSRTAQQSATCGRTAHLTPEAAYSPCLVKSQSHMAKDALYLRTPDGRLLFPSEKLFARLNEIPDDFTFRATTQSLALEQIGQSISYRMHHSLMRSVKEHLLSQRGIRIGAVVSNTPGSAESVVDRPTAPTPPTKRAGVMRQDEFLFTRP